jgi:hypothetical protein
MRTLIKIARLILQAPLIPIAIVLGLMFVAFYPFLCLLDILDRTEERMLERKYHNKRGGI